MQIRKLYQNRDYSLLWTGQVLSTLGSSASAVVYPLLILDLVNSPAAAGITGAMAALPYLIFSLPAGALIDRWNRKTVMVICDVGRLLTLTALCLALYFDVLAVWQIYLAAFLEGSFFVFFNIAEVAALPRIVSKEMLPVASSQNEAGMGVAHIVGPTMGTFLYQTFGRIVPFVVDAMSYAISVCTLFFIKVQFQTEREAERRHLRHEIAEGLKWLWTQPLIRFMAFLTGGSNLVFASISILIIMIAKGMGISDAHIGLIFSISGVGGIVGSLIGGQIQRRYSFGQVITGVMWGQTILFPLFYFSGNYIVLGLIAALIFAMGPIYNVVQFSYRISIIPDALQGRVNSAFRLIAFGFGPIGSSSSGFLIEKMGVGFTVSIFTCVFFLLALLTTFNSHVQNARPIDKGP